MIEALAASQALLWIAVVGLAVMVWVLTRQIGVLHERIAPMGAMMMQGARVGDPAPVVRGRSLEGEAVEVGGASSDGRSLLLLFVSSDCPVCTKVGRFLGSFGRAEADRVEVVLIGASSARESREFVRRHRLESFRFVQSPAAGLAFEIGKLPYAVLIDEEGIVRSKGLVNTREHLESLVVARETGYPSLDAYMRADGDSDGRRGTRRGARKLSSPNDR